MALQGGAAPAAGAGSEMDLATILATFPPDVREEVLLTSEEDVINSLPPALLAEAQQLRQRVMQHYRYANALLKFCQSIQSQLKVCFGKCRL